MTTTKCHSARLYETFDHVLLYISHAILTSFEDRIIYTMKLLSGNYLKERLQYPACDERA